MLKRILLAALFSLLMSPAFADEGFKEAAVCFIRGKVFIVNDPTTISYYDNYAVLSINGDTKSGIWIPRDLGSCMYTKDYDNKIGLYKTMRELFSSATVINTLR